MVSYTSTLNTATTVVTYAEAKAHLNLTHDYQQDLVEAFIDSATVMAENYTAQAINIYDVVAITDDFYDGLQLQKTPLKGDVVIQYYNSNNALQTLDSSKYLIRYDGSEPTICYTSYSTLPAVYDRIDAVNITYQTGYGAGDVPKPYKTFVLLMVAHFYENRSDSVDKLPRYSSAVLRPYKKW